MVKKLFLALFLLIMLSSCSAVEDNNISELSTSKNIEKNILAL
jgi:ABC-type uncharacterized transport system auxiliary subunit